MEAWKDLGRGHVHKWALAGLFPNFLEKSHLMLCSLDLINSPIVVIITPPHPTPITRLLAHLQPGFIMG